MESALDRLNRLSVSGKTESYASPPSANDQDRAVAYPPIDSYAYQGSAPPAAAVPNGGGATGDEDVSQMFKRQASELEKALRANSGLEADVQRQASELSALQSRLSNKDSELKQAESQLRQKESRIASLEQSLGGGAPGSSSLSSKDEPAELMDVMAERDALQEALRMAQQELARETAKTSTLEAKMASLKDSHQTAPSVAPAAAAELEALKEQLEAEQVEVAALQESLRRAELEWSSSHKEVVALKEARERSEAQAADAQERADGIQEQARSLQRMLGAKDEAIQELTEKLERGLMDRIQFDGGAGGDNKDMWQLGLTNEQMQAIDGIVAKWREGYGRKEGELNEALDSLQEQEDTVSRIAGIARRAMESIRSSYLRSSGGAAAGGGGGGSPERPGHHQRNPEEAARDEAMLDVSRFETPEEMLGSLAQFAANKSHAVMRLEQEVARKGAELYRMEGELQRSYGAQKAEQELEEARRDLDDRAAECSELRVSLSRRSEEAAAAQVEVRVLHEEVSAAREEAAQLREQLEDAEEDVVRTRQEVSDLAIADVARLREELEKSHSEVLPLKEQLNRRTREVRELNHMLKAWEAMRLGKDAQIASLMERCKRHEEEAAEKARSVDSLRRKLALAGTGTDAGGSSGSGTPTGRRARHIHVHMHHQPSSEAGSDYGGLGSTITGDYGGPSAFGNSSFASGSSSLQASQNF